MNCQHFIIQPVFSGENIDPGERCQTEAIEGQDYCADHLEEHEGYTVEDLNEGVAGV